MTPYIYIHIYIHIRIYIYVNLHLHLQIDGAYCRSIERHFYYLPLAGDAFKVNVNEYERCP